MNTQNMQTVIDELNRTINEHFGKEATETPVDFLPRGEDANFVDFIYEAGTKFNQNLRFFHSN